MEPETRHDVQAHWGQAPIGSFVPESILWHGWFLNDFASDGRTETDDHTDAMTTDGRQER